MAVIIYTLGQCGISWEDVLHGIPAALGNQLMACHWIAQGIEIESPTNADTTDAIEQFKQLSKRSKSWQLEQL